MTQPLRRVAAIAAGGAAGAVARWAVLAAYQPHTVVPWPVVLVNVAGAMLLGALLAIEVTHPRQRLLLHDVGAIGFCGAFTTFSTFSVGTVELLSDDEPLAALIYVAASVGLSLSGVFAGAALMHRARAVELPVEEEP